MGFEILPWEKSFGERGHPMLSPLPMELLEVGEGVAKVLDALVEPFLQTFPGNVVQKCGHVCASVGHQDCRGVAGLTFLLINPCQELLKTLLWPLAGNHLSVLVHQPPPSPSIVHLYPVHKPSIEFGM